MSRVEWYTRADGTDVPRFGMRICAFTDLSTAASRCIDARYAAGGQPPGSPAKVAADDLRTTLDDRRAAHTLALGYRPDELRRDGLRHMEDT